MSNVTPPAPPPPAPRRTPWFVWALLGVLLLPVALMLIGSLPVMVWVGLHVATGLRLPPAIESLLPLGALGDTFGGLLGPLLNTLVLGATIMIAITQGKQSRDALAQSNKQFQDEWQQNADSAELRRASGVVAWIAETPRSRDGSSHLGVVVTNQSGSLVRDLDLVVTVKAPSLRKGFALRNRESVVPPGSWFLQLDRDEIDREDAASDVNGGWPPPVPIDVGGHFRVTLPSAERGDDSETAYALRPHPPERAEDGSHLPYFTVDDLRFTLAGQRWRRDESGSLDRHDEDKEWNRQFSELAATPRLPAQGPKQVHRKNPDVQERIRKLAAALTARPEDGVMRDTRYALVPELHDAGLVQLRVTSGGQGISFYARTDVADGEGVIWLAGRGVDGLIPSALSYTGEWKREEAPSLKPLRQELQRYSDRPEAMAQKLIEEIASYGPQRSEAARAD